MTAKVIPLHEPKPKPRKCSFCGKQEGHSARMFSNNVSNNERCICDECVKLAKLRCEGTNE